MAKPLISYHEFEERCRSRWRFLHDPDVLSFLEDLAERARASVIDLPEGDTLWRASLGCESEESPPLDEAGSTTDVAVAYDERRLRPHIDHAADGRVTPRGILCLYAARDENTAVAEVRPHVGEAVTTARVLLRRAIRVVDCHAHHDASIFKSLFLRDTNPGEANWVEMNTAFARPRFDRQRTDLYAPTQIIAEKFRQAGFDGIAYRSAMSPGMNVAIFDPEVASIDPMRVVTIRDIQINFEEPLQKYPSDPRSV